MGINNQVRRYLVAEKYYLLLKKIVKTYFFRIDYLIFVINRESMKDGG